MWFPPKETAYMLGFEKRAGTVSELIIIESQATNPRSTIYIWQVCAESETPHSTEQGVFEVYFL